MTIREAYENTLINLNKKKAPALYLDDFLVLFKSAVQDHVNQLYALYETSQQLSDDLHNLHRHIIINLGGNLPFPLNVKYYDGTPFVAMPSVITTMSGISGGQFNTEGPQSGQTFLFHNIYYSYVSSQLRKNIIVNNETVLNGAILNELRFDESIQAVSGTIVKIVRTNGNIKIEDYTKYGFGTKVRFSFDLKGVDQIMITNLSPAYFLFNGNNYELLSEPGYNFIDDERVIVSCPDNYWHLLGLESNYDYRKNDSCTTYIRRRNGGAKLTSDRQVSIHDNSYLKPKSTRPYFLVKNNFSTVYPKIELLYRDISEKDLVKLVEVELLYLKEPKIYNLLDEQLDGEDTTDAIEFQEYICQELVEQVVKLVLENNSDPRTQSFTAVNESNTVSRTFGLGGGRK